MGMLHSYIFDQQSLLITRLATTTCMYSHGSLKYICQTDTFLTLSSLLPDKNKFFTCCYSIVSNLLWHMLGKGTVPKLTSVHNQIWTKRRISSLRNQRWSCCSSHKQLSTTSTQLRMNWVDNTGVDETEADKLGYITWYFTFDGRQC